ncbi:hypothetical protein Fot_48144 [Forsythia ovata]|uniref:Uncharacterized protein n=1 Tax=Forsythia ovata TaxID=205694 RepID=A0ABD1QSE5_9LAMI
MAKMNTARSYVLNCELYKVFVKKIDELHSTVVGVEDIDKLRSENKILRSRPAVSEDVSGKAEYKINMTEAIQKSSLKARKRAVLKLKVCEDMAHAKHKELMKALVELSTAKELLAKQGVPGYVNPKCSIEMYES